MHLFLSDRYHEAIEESPLQSPGAASGGGTSTFISHLQVAGSLDST